MIKNSLNIIALCLIISAAFASPDQIRNLHQQAYRLLDEDMEEAYLMALKARQQASNEKETFLEAQSLFIQAYVFRMQGKMGASFMTNLDALNLLKPITTDEAINTHLKLLVNTGEILEHHYAFDQAILSYNKGIEIAKKYQKDQRLVNLYFNKAFAQNANKENDQALETIELTLELARNLQDETMILLSLNLQGLILVDLENYEKSREVFQSIIQYPFESEDTNKYIADAWHNIGHILGTEGLLEQAHEAYLRALHFREMADGSDNAFLTYLDLTELNYLLEDYSKADYYGELALGLYDQADLVPKNYRLFELLSKIALKQHNSIAAFDYVQKYYQENMRFLQIQSELLKTRSQYNMEVLTAGFFNSTESDNRASMLEYVLWLVGLAMFGLIFLFKVKSWYLKRTLTRELIQIDKESIV